MDKKYNASIKIMKSYDYCHFEVNLGVEDPQSAQEIDKMMNVAQRLCDIHIEKYKKAKEKASRGLYNPLTKTALHDEVNNIRTKPFLEWTDAEKAKVKAVVDNFYDSEDEYFEED